ncbi:16S rRNA (adenine(1518)-N(6)/adenine(1519)-N(6))-dimethyltransferase RsmA [Chrysanthemum yellows phytoplasma]|uniref:16S rRNA (adenine(1518)-N(6)/adenine(1519)-N(6))- dimethyltransferase RsmA n=1 Tax=Chrysanthemum yellows phytoplasma TaxID=238674 RepID=UPI00054CB442|nr:16S rRNA (adenine(1518)-N(6)/adenine(1519)-N(6))-dimethyltransferase RsmA [Chrysanthemum yellows phytoplasma]
MHHTTKKKYSQNFLTDVNLLNKIVTKASITDKNVLEIGPGKGALTKIIVPQAKHVLAYEIDATLKPFLNFENHNNVNIIYDDFLKRDLLKDFDHYFSPNSQLSLIGNLPYYITSPIIFKIIDTPQINDATIMIQKEVGMRLLAQPNNKNYNALSVIIQFLFSIEKIQEVKRHMFFPAPKVDSIVIKLTKNNNICPTLLQQFIKFVKASFKQKRKTLLNNLSCQFLLSKENIIPFFLQHHIPLQIRAEQVTLENFQKLTVKWFIFFNMS